MYLSVTANIVDCILILDNYRHIFSFKTLQKKCNTIVGGIPTFDFTFFYFYFLFFLILIYYYHTTP